MPNIFNRPCRTGVVTVILCIAFSLCCRAENRPPNILLILTDDQGWSQLSTMMDPYIAEARSSYLETPNMARLVEEGMRFTSGYSPAPLCTPTRRSILCGTSAARSGSEFRSKWIPADHTTIPKALKSANSTYHCAHFGKWGEQMISTPEQCGYDASDGETGNNTGGMPTTLDSKFRSHSDEEPYFIDNKDPKLTGTVTDHTIRFMKEQAKAGHPFYVQASYYAVHLSVVAKQKTVDKYKAKGTPDRGYTEAWAAMLEELDQGVGRLLDAITGSDISDNTYIFFTTDNGGRGTVPGGDPERTPTNFPLTGAKHSLHEGGIRVPFIVRGPGIPAGSVCRTPVAGYDFLATFYDLAGGSQPLSPEVDGISFAKLLKDPGATLQRPQKALFFHRPGKRESAVRQGDLKLFVNWNPKGEINSRELYQVEPNPRERGHNIASKHPEKADAMQSLLLGYLKSVNAETTADLPKKRKKNRKQ
ncbi:MAG: sulfatase [Verrucomicrobiales bacterium]|nr:sulfatase [Verrucomicrobiales bacterium]